MDLDYPGYDGMNLPFPGESQDFVYASHTLEHVVGSPDNYIFSWFRVVKEGGFLIICVPHADLFEKKVSPPSQFEPACHGHRWFFTPMTLLTYVEAALTPNSYRIVHMRDCDDAYNYDRPVSEMPETRHERYEIELVLKKIKTPSWKPIA